MLLSISINRFPYSRQYATPHNWHTVYTVNTHSKHFGQQQLGLQLLVSKQCGIGEQYDDLMTEVGHLVISHHHLM